VTDVRKSMVERLRFEVQPALAGGSPMRSLSFTKDEGKALLALIEAAHEMAIFQGDVCPGDIERALPFLISEEP
jgi:hypothetical protein